MDDAEESNVHLSFVPHAILVSNSRANFVRRICRAFTFIAIECLLFNGLCSLGIVLPKTPVLVHFGNFYQ